VGLAFSSLNAVPASRRHRNAVLDFIYDRLRVYLRDQGLFGEPGRRPCSTPAPTRSPICRRACGSASIRRAFPKPPPCPAANKRIVNNPAYKSGSEAASAVEPARLAEGAEQDLYATFQRIAPQVETDFGRGDFTNALRVLATAKPAVDRYFDDVMVMADDPAVRANRLALLRGVAGTMNRVADISKLAS
jgi:glycyl-tRNA synthetase beta chain